MLLTVLLVSGAILGATAIAGVLMLNQIRQSTNVTNSLQAIFAADSGLEWELYKNFRRANYPQPRFQNADFVTQVSGGGSQIEFRAVGCAGARRETSIAGQCPRVINRSLQLFFVIVR